MISKSTKFIRTVLLFIALSAIAYAATAVAVSAFAELAPIGASTEASVYKCYVTPRPGLPQCEKIAGTTKPLATVQAAYSNFSSGVALSADGSSTEVNTHGGSAGCRVVGTGPGYAIIVCNG